MSGQDRSSQFGSSCIKSGPVKSIRVMLSKTGQVGLFFIQKLCGPKCFLGSNFFKLKIILGPKQFSTQDFSTKHFFLTQTFVCWAQDFLYPTFFWATKYFRTNEVAKNCISNLNPKTKMHLKLEFDSGVGPTCSNDIIANTCKPD